MQERRAEKRFRLSLNAVLDEGAACGCPILRTRDVSSAGAFVNRDSESGGGPWNEGDMVRVGIYLPAIGEVSTRPVSVIRAEGRIVRSERGGLAVRFGRQCQIQSLGE